MAELFAVEGRPIMRRACLNRVDSTLNILWFKPTDNCGSFTSFSLYGRDNPLGVFQFLDSCITPNKDNFEIKLKNLRRWEFYLVYNKTCNGLDSIYSDTILIDDEAPENSLIDSVSVDLATQKTLIGWQQNNSKDVKGYYVYHVTGNNSVITTTQNINYLDLGSRDPRLGSVSYSIAAFDSCNIASLISASHATMLLRSVYNECNKTINLSWNNYVGWNVSSYQIFRKINAGNYELVGTVVSNINQFTYNIVGFGDEFCFFVRALKQGRGASSSSTSTCIKTSPIIASKNSYIAKASVENKFIELVLITENNTSVQKIEVYKSEGVGNFVLWQTINTNGGLINLLDNAVNTDRFSYSYFFRTIGPCDFVFDSSQTAKTVLLNIVLNNPGNQSLSWSLYNDFIKNTQKQELLLSNSPDFNKSSPWNTINTFNNNTTAVEDNTPFTTNEFLCFCIRSIENAPNIPFNRQDSSYSNIRCLTAEPIVYFPNAIQINGYNTVFKPKGQFLDKETSYFLIFNRWGELIKRIDDIDAGWDGTDKNGDFVMSDVYAFKAYINGTDGTKLSFSGTITVLK